MEGDANLAAITYENIITQEDPWDQCSDTIWILGKSYKLPIEKEDFLDHVKSLLWFTYRKNFSSIGGTGPTSDSGWGCMMRCGQMTLAQAFMQLSLGAAWRWNANGSKPVQYMRILEQFLDHRTSCYSIQQIATMGVEEGKSVGSWFGPNTIAQVLKRLSVFDKLNNACVYVAMDNTICIQDVESVVSKRQTKQSPSNGHTSGESRSYAQCVQNGNDTETTSWSPLIVIVPLRLGLLNINSSYYNNLKNCFHWKQCIGVIGGKPNHAYYFVGYTSSNQLVFLDPHTTQNVVKNDPMKPDINDTSYHCGSPSRMPITQLDPSLAACFVCGTRSEFNDLCSKVKNMKQDKMNYPLFEVVDSMPTCNIVESQVVSVSRHNRDKKNMNGLLDENACLTLDSDEDLDDCDEEFEILEIY